MGKNVVLGHDADERILAHELAHVAQQYNHPIPDKIKIAAPSSPTEHAAQLSERNLNSGSRAKLTGSSEAHLARKPGAWFSYPFSGPTGMEIILDTPATMANADARVAALLRAAATLNPEEAADMSIRLSDRKTRLGARFRRLRTASRTKTLSIVNARAAAKPAHPAKNAPSASAPAASKLTAQETAVGTHAYYASTRQGRKDSRVRHEAGVRAELRELTPGEIESRWKRDKKAFITAANTPDHGLKARQMHWIYVRYWGGRVDAAVAHRVNIFHRGQNLGWDRALTVELEQAQSDEELSRGPLSASPEALKFLRTADARNKSFTLDEVTQAALDASNFRQIVALLAGAVAGSGVKIPTKFPGRTRATASSEPRGSVSGRPPSNVASGEINVPTMCGSVSGRAPSNVASGEIAAKPARSSVQGKPPSSVASGEVNMAGVGPLVKPRSTSRTEYHWAHPGMKKGNFVKAELENGILSITVKAHGPNRRSGRNLIDSAFNHFGAKNIKEFQSLWNRNSSFRDNYDQYAKNVQNNMNETAAAEHTWIGRQLVKRGFVCVKVPRQSSDAVTPVFRKTSVNTSQ